MKKAGLCALWTALAAGTAFSRTVATGTIVANPGATISVPVTIDDLSDMGAAVAVVGYDATVLVCLGVDNGELAGAKDMTYLDSGSGRLCAVFSGFKKSEGGGELMRIRFSVRDGTQGLFSDVTIQDFQCGAKDGVSDLSVKNPLATVNGMVRVLGTDAAAARLEEGFVVWPKTRLKTLTLSAGDRIAASDDRMAIAVSGAVTASSPIPVVRPLGGWQTGRYALLTTPTDGLEFSFAEVTNQSEIVSISKSQSDGMTTYWAEAAVEGQIRISFEGGEIAAETMGQIRKALAEDLAPHPEVTEVVVKGDVAQIPVTVDLGISPHVDILGTTATAMYAQPTLSITEFDPKTGRVRIKVSPGEGNDIRSALVTGCIHVYGTSDLSEKMRYISGTAFDLTPYLRSDTKGEADLTVSLGSYTFIKVKAESITKQEGEIE